MQWLQEWTSPLSTERPIVTWECVVALGRGDEAFEHLPCPEPGSRIVLLVQVTGDLLGDSGHVEDADWVGQWAANQLVPEVSHKCDPVPGDPRFGTEWLRQNGVTAHHGWFTVGCVLARRLTEADLHASSLQVVADSALLPRYFPLAHGEEMPLPLASGIRSARELSSAYGLTVADFAPLLDELLWSGTVRVTTPPR